MVRFLTSQNNIITDTLTHKLGNHFSNDDTAMSGLDYPMSGITNRLKSSMTPNSHSSLNTGQTQQQAEMARMLQPTIRALQSATDKAINKGAKVAKEVFIGSNPPTEPRAMRRISRCQTRITDGQSSAAPGSPGLTSKKVRKRKKKDSGKDTQMSNNPSNSLTKPKKKKKKKKSSGKCIQMSNATGNPVTKAKKKSSWRGKDGDNMAGLLERRKLEDTKKLSAADSAARTYADEKVEICGNRIDPSHWQTIYEQEYQARTARLRERQLRDDQALISALDGLSLGGPKNGNDEYDFIL